MIIYEDHIFIFYSYFNFKKLPERISGLLKMTGRDTGATREEYAKYIMDTIQDPELESKFEKYSKS